MARPNNSTNSSSCGENLLPVFVQSKYLTNNFQTLPVYVQSKSLSDNNASLNRSTLLPVFMQSKSVFHHRNNSENFDEITSWQL